MTHSLMVATPKLVRVASLPAQVCVLDTVHGGTANKNRKKL